MTTPRRTFLKTAAATAFGFQLVPRHVLGGDGHTPPSRKLNIAAIGAGGQAASDLKNMLGENIVALCDVDEKRAEMFKHLPDAKKYQDFRVMPGEMGDKIDAVLVGTPDHTHAAAAMAAMKAGKHVYCEKQGETFPSGSQVSFEFAAKGRRGPVKLVWYDGQRDVPRPKELEAARKGVATGAVVVGRHGTIVYGAHGAGGVRLIPEKAMQAYKRPEPKIPRVRGGHQRDWLDAVREGRPAGSPFEYGGRLSEIGLLGAIAVRVSGKKLQYDEQAMRFTNCDQANRLLDPPYRSGWSLG